MKRILLFVRCDRRENNIALPMTQSSTWKNNGSCGFLFLLFPAIVVLPEGNIGSFYPFFVIIMFVLLIFSYFFRLGPANNRIMSFVIFHSFFFSQSMVFRLYCITFFVFFCYSSFYYFHSLHQKRFIQF